MEYRSPRMVHLAQASASSGWRRERWLFRALAPLLLVMPLGIGLLGGVESDGADDADLGPISGVPESHIEHLYRLLLRAREERASGRLHDARDLLREAAAVQPENVAVADELKVVEQLLGLRDVNDTLPLDQTTSAELELARAETRVWLRRIALLIGEGQFSRAQDAIRSAQAHVQTYPWPEAESALKQMAEWLAMAVEEERRGSEREARSRRQQAQDLAQEVQQIEEAEQQSLFSSRLERIVGMQQRGHYELALAQARHLVADYPQRNVAAALFERLLVQVYEQRELDIEQRKAAHTAEVFDRIHRALIPEGFDGQPQFPADWNERGQRQASGLDGVVAIPEWQEALLDRLSQRLSVDFADVDPLEAMEFIAQRAGINIVIASDVRMAANPPLSLTANGMRVDNLYTWIARQLGTTWRLHRQAVFIGGEEVEPPILRVYDLGEAVFSVPDFPGPDLSVLQLSGSGGGGGGGGAGGGFDLFGGAGGFAGDDEGLGADDVLDLIREAIDPTAWDNPAYGLEVRSGNYLLVNAPPRLQVLVQEFLRSQMGLNRTMVSTELRWLEVHDEYLEEIGIDWGGPNNSLLVAGGGLGNNGFRRGNSSSSASAVGNIINRLPETAMDIAPALASSGLNLHIVNLGATHLQGMLTAIERTNRGRQVSGVDLVAMHGQRAHAMFLRQVAYISDYDVDGGTLDPVISTVNVGDMLDIQPFVSADRKYVTMDLRPINSTIELFTERISVVTVVADVAVVQSYPLELPNIRINSAATRVMIPDGGSIMVGGFTDALNQTAQSNVPLLGHVPFVGRLFGKRGRYSQNTQMILTVTVDIILYDEEEELL